MLYTKLPKSIHSLALVTFINGLGSFIFPFLTLFLTLKMGYSKTRAGYFILYASIMYVPGSLVSSKLADSFSRKNVMVISQFLFSLSFILCGIFIDNYEVLPFLILVGLLFDGATDPARKALHTDHTTLENRKEAFSLFYLCHNLGFAIGPAIAGLFFNNYPKWIFLITGFIGIVSILIVLFTIKDKRPDEQMIEESLKGEESDKAVKGGIFKALFQRPLLLFYITINCIFWFAYAIVRFALPLYTANIFNESGPSIFGFLMACNAITVVVFTPIIVKHTKKQHPLLAIGASLLLYSIGYLILGLTSLIVVIFISVFIYSIGEVLHATNNDFFIMNNTPLGHRARFSTVITIIQGIGFAYGPVIGGKYLDKHSYSSLFLICSITVLFCLLLLVVLSRLYRRKGK